MDLTASFDNSDFDIEAPDWKESDKSFDLSTSRSSLPDAVQDGFSHDEINLNNRLDLNAWTNRTTILRKLSSCLLQ